MFASFQKYLDKPVDPHELFQPSTHNNSLLFTYGTIDNNKFLTDRTAKSSSSPGGTRAASKT